MNPHNQILIDDFLKHLLLERSMALNSIDAYKDDMEKLLYWTEEFAGNRNLEDIGIEDLSAFLEYIARLGLKTRTQARILSAVKHFYNYLILDKKIVSSPAYLLSSPKLEMKLPTVLSTQEIDEIEAAIDLSSDEGERNRAIIETLYSCGLRVSELVNLKLQDINLDMGFIRVTGKGDKMRQVPISEVALKYINFYFEKSRCHLAINNENKDYVFLNRRGRKLTRVMIFTIVKRLCEAAGIVKDVSPHTFRHSFATHLLKGGASLRAIQEMLGHESIQTTEIYTHLDTNYLRDEIMKHHPRSKRNLLNFKDY